MRLPSTQVAHTEKECEAGVGENVSLAIPPPLMVVVTESGMCGGFFL